MGPAFQLILEGFKADHEVWMHIVQNQLKNSLFETLFFSLISISSGVLIGISAGSATFFFSKFKHFLDLSMGLLVAMPTYVFGFAYLSFLDFSGPAQKFLNSQFGDDFFFEPRNLVLGGIIFGFSCSPYVYFAIRTALMFNSSAFYESALLLGRNKIDSFRESVLPTLKPWVLSASLMIFLEGLSDYGFVDLYGIDTLSRNLFKTWSSLFSFGNAARLGIIILIICISSSLILGKLQENNKNFSLIIKTNEFNNGSKYPFLAILFFIIFMIFSIFIPIGMLISNITAISLEKINEVVNAAIQTLKVSTFSALFVTLTFGIFYILVRKSRSFFLIKFFSSGYGIPGTLLAVAFYIFFNKLFSFFFESRILIPSIILICFVFVIKFGGIVLRQLENIKSQLNQDILDSASLLSPPFKVLQQIEWPQYRSGLSIGFLLVFLEVAKELPATMMLKPTSTPTLAMRIHQFASESDWETGSVYSLALLALVVFLLTLKFLITSFYERKKYELF
jgi:iron(III) transport system permease protein